MKFTRPKPVAYVSKSVTAVGAAGAKKLAKTKASVSAAGTSVKTNVSAAGTSVKKNVKKKMQRFSIANVMGRKSVPEDLDARPSVISVMNLNRKLNDEVKKSDVHLFFGPQQAIFDGRDRTRALHGERKIQKTAKKFWLMSEPLSLDRDSTTSLIGFPTETPTKAGGLASTLSAAGRFLGQKVAQMKMPPTHVNDDSFCDGCGMDPIVGNMYSCSTCDNYSLCESCYQAGIHGYEDSELLKNVREDFALRNIVDHCRQRVPEKVFDVLMRKVCRGQVDKFNFLATWISRVVLGHPLHELSVRGIEIPHLDAETRTTLVELLTPVLAERTDLEVCMEWFCPEAANDDIPNSQRKLETLRIWVATDKDSKSPFASKDSSKEGDTESDMSPSSIPDALRSPGSPTTPFSPSGDLLGDDGLSPPNSPRSDDGLSPPVSPRDDDGLSPPASPRSDEGLSPPASPQFGALSIDDHQNNDYQSDSDGRSESSVIEPKLVDDMSESGQRSEGIEM